MSKSYDKLLKRLKLRWDDQIYLIVKKKSGKPIDVFDLLQVFTKARVNYFAEIRNYIEYDPILEERMTTTKVEFYFYSCTTDEKVMNEFIFFEDWETKRDIQSSIIDLLKELSKYGDTVFYE